MNEVLIAFLILFTVLVAIAIIVFILRVDAKVKEVNGIIEKVKTVDFIKIKNIVLILNKINTYIHFDKVKYWFEVSMTMLSAVNLGLLAGKLVKKTRG